MAEGQRDDRGALVIGLVDRGRDRAEQRERLHVDRLELDVRCVERRGKVVDGLAVRGRQDHAVRNTASVEIRRTDDVVVHYRLVHRDRERLVCTERDGVGELLVVVDPVDVEDADTDPVRSDSEANALPGQVVLLEELVERTAERRDVADLAADHDAGLERLACKLDELRPPLL